MLAILVTCVTAWPVQDGEPASAVEASTVVFAEDFESFDRNRWDDFGRHPSNVAIVGGGVGGGQCAQITATLGADTGGHLYKMLDPGLDTCHLRFYVKFEPEHDYLHHFVHLCGYRPPTRWPQGGAGERPRGDERFSTGIEPWGDWGRHAPPGAWHFYSYWCEMERSRDGRFWGNSFAPDPPVQVERGRWICVEIMLRCNSHEDRHDGEQALWIDGAEVGRWSGIRWRTDPRLKVNGVWMLDYITDNAARQNRVVHPRKVNRVWFDEIVVADSYIGPLQDPDQPHGVRRRVAGSNRLAGELFRQLGREPGNVVFSPYSVAEAFAMCAAATSGKTRDEIAAVLHLETTTDGVHPTMARLRRVLRGGTRDGGNDGRRDGHGAAVQLHVANRLWGHRRVPDGYYQEPFLRLAGELYDAGFARVDFAAAGQARATINSWVADRTAQRVPELIPDGVLDGLVRLVLTNAVYFKGTWRVPFDANLTKPAPFRVGPDRTVTVPMMTRTGAARLGISDGAQVLELPYAGDALAMLVVLPARGAELAALEKQLDAERVSRWRRCVAAADATVQLPRFRIAAGYRLHERALPALGMTAPFRFSDDWQPLNGGAEELRIAAVFHDAFVQVDEQGTEAAAATGIVAKTRGVQPRSEFRADRPFLFAIVHRDTGLVLFLGRVVDPATEGGR